MLIGELSKRSGLSRDTIRYYEKLKLFVVKDRHANNTYKDYGQDALKHLQSIQQLKDVGFTLREIQQFLTTEGNNHPCSDLPLKLAKKITSIDKQLANLLSFKESLLEMQRRCNARCKTISDMPTCVPKVKDLKQTTSCC